MLRTVFLDLGHFLKHELRLKHIFYDYLENTSRCLGQRCLVDFRDGIRAVLIMFCLPVLPRYLGWHNIIFFVPSFLTTIICTLAPFYSCVLIVLSVHVIFYAKLHLFFGFFNSFIHPG